MKSMSGFHYYVNDIIIWYNTGLYFMYHFNYGQVQLFMFFLVVQM